MTRPRDFDHSPIEVKFPSATVLLLEQAFRVQATSTWSRPSLLQLCDPFAQNPPYHVENSCDRLRSGFLALLFFCSPLELSTTITDGGPQKISCACLKGSSKDIAIPINRDTSAPTRTATSGPRHRSPRPALQPGQRRAGSPLPGRRCDEDSPLILFRDSCRDFAAATLGSA